MYRLASPKVVLYFIVLLILDGCLASVVSFPFALPWMLYLAILFVAFEWHWKKALAVALIVGLLRDGVGTQPLGVETLVLSLLAFILGFFVQKVERQSWLMRMATGFLFVFASTLLVVTFSKILGAHSAFSWHSVSVSFGVALSTALFMPIFFYLSRLWFGMSESLKQYELFG